MGIYVMYLILTVTGLSLVKLDKTPLMINLKNSGLNVNIGLLTIIGMICYVGSFCIFMGIIQKSQISYIFPVLNGIVTIMTFIVGLILFNEILTGSKVIGLLFIVVGIIIMNFKG